ncbi:type VII secretion-associated serine protease mycosin [Amycolatopsis echigonensis]|uniref:Membrane-anchored mycosin MYCP n=1 Tax=Amycolatopsis echigonensis TaxID=2576905 RepID=A0A2N3WDU6_9PSEU|nr:MULTISPECIES: type VII secretion-associated serine protease mycosin [Amycolatopsis]MBB2500963.1 type VII secretion-associated serine protease mycosin [Amycolatopsis echigonensis]PKV92076.1 membrane-anchored mycosin MYCP [Amycolatopsis niigatensis]
MGSRRSFPRKLGLPGRAGVALFAAGLGLASPFAAAPASAQTADAPAGTWATPPPLGPGDAPPADTGHSDTTYKKKNECVQRSLGQNVEINFRPWGQDYLQLQKAQEIVRAATGSVGGNQKVAVIDTGVTPHPWFQGRVESGGDYVATPDNGAEPGLQDCDGHGTEVAGIIAGNPQDPKVGFIGVAPDAHIVSYRQLSENYAKDDSPQQPSAPPSGSNSQQPPAGGSSNSQLPPSSGGGTGGGSGTAPQQDNKGDNRQLQKEGTAGTLNTLAQIIRGIADSGRAKVINMSVDHCRAGTAPGDIQEGERKVQAAVHYAVERDIVVIAAAGNVSENCPQNDQADPNKPKSIVTPPWFSDDVLSVGAIQEDGSVAPFSVHGPWVGVAAPGTKIVSLDPAEHSTGLANLTIANGNPSPIQGTSFAAPYVAGVAALVRSMYPKLNARDVVKRLKATAQHPAAPGGRDNFVGYGVIDPVAALTANLPGDTGNLSLPKPVVQEATLPPADGISSTPMIVALAGTGGGVAALLITLFVVHTIRRNRSGSPPAR